MGKKLLIIGNGFDLAHGLPTRYADFLGFAFLFKKIYTFGLKHSDYAAFCEEVSKWENSTYLKTFLTDYYVDRKMLNTEESEGKHYSVTLDDEALDRMAEDLYNNAWFVYLFHIHTNNMTKGGNWIDFESEISYVIQFIDKNADDTDEMFADMCKKINFDRSTPAKINLFLRFCDTVEIIEDYGGKIEGFINKLYDDLEKLTDALNVYLSRFVEKLSVQELEVIQKIVPDCVISFNYTHTFQNVYKSSAPICYIHGESNDANGRDCNMVIGVDEYLDLEQRNINTKMAIFKKCVQRIRKKNDTRYRKWLNEMIEVYSYYQSYAGIAKNLDSYKNGFSDVFVFGHSLDITDIDVLQLFLKPEFTSLHIYSKGKMNEGKSISNLIKIVGEDVLVEKSYGNPSRLELIVL